MRGIDIFMISNCIWYPVIMKEISGNILSNTGGNGQDVYYQGM